MFPTPKRCPSRSRMSRPSSLSPRLPWPILSPRQRYFPGSPRRMELVTMNPRWSLSSAVMPRTCPSPRHWTTSWATRPPTMCPAGRPRGIRASGVSPRALTGPAPLVSARNSLHLESRELIKNIGPVLVSAALIPDAAKLHIRGLKSGRVMQDCPLT